MSRRRKPRKSSRGGVVVSVTPSWCSLQSPHALRELTLKSRRPPPDQAVGWAESAKPTTEITDGPATTRVPNAACSSRSGSNVSALSEIVRLCVVGFARGAVGWR